MKEHILSAAEAKLQHVLLFELVVTLRFYTLIVQVGSIPRTQIDDVRLHSPARGAIRPCELH